MLPKLDAIVVFVDNLEQCTRFYRDLVGLEVTFTDDVSIGFRLGSQDFLLLKRTSAAQMITEEAVSRAGHNVLLCAGFEDVDAAYQSLMGKGISFIKAPKDQDWGRRTAYFADPEGNLWEIWQSLESN